MVAAMNAIGYDIWTTGNHEYNYGMDVLKKVMGQQKAKVLTGNVYAPDGTPLADGYTIIKKGTVKIGVIGMVTPNIIRWDAVRCVNVAGEQDVYKRQALPHSRSLPSPSSASTCTSLAST